MFLQAALSAPKTEDAAVSQVEQQGKLMCIPLELG
jgi:hypothetical protein